MRKKLNKKGLSFKFLISIIVIVSFLTLVIRFSNMTEEIKDRPFGTTQMGILMMGVQGDYALMSLDASTYFAKNRTEDVFDEEGGITFFFENEKNPCDIFFETNNWYDGKNYCLPPFEKNLASLFNTFLSQSLYQQPLFYYPSFTITATPNEQTTTLTGTSAGKVIITGRVGGTEVFSMDGKRFLTPDYEGATFYRPLNFGDRNGQEITNIVVHYTATSTLEQAVSTLLQKGFSYHYIIDKDGEIYQFVLEKDAAQHAGCSKKDLGDICIQENMNNPTIGISFVNKGYIRIQEGKKCSGYESDEPYKGFTCWHSITEEQKDSFAKLVASIGTRTEGFIEGNGNIKNDIFIMHSDIKETKYDPGPTFTDAKEFNAILLRINDELQNPPVTETEANEETSSTEELKKRDEKTIANIETIGPGPEVCKGNEAPPSKIFDDRLNGNAWFPDTTEMTYQDIVLEIAQEKSVDPALLTTHMVLESSLGKDNRCTKKGKSALTGCGWPPGCSDGCKCTADAIESDYTQVSCTADTDTIAFKEALTGKHLGAAGLYEKCGHETTAKGQWTCILCIYQGNYAKDVTNSGKPYYLDGGRTCDYAEKFFEHYCSWRAYYESTGLLSDYSTGRGYRTTYELPVSFQEEIDVNINELIKIREVINKTARECYDNTEVCLKEHLQQYNQELATRMSPIQPPLKAQEPLNLELISPTNNLFAEDFVSKLASCFSIQNDSSCQIRANETLYDKDFEIEFTHDTLLYTKGRNGIKALYYDSHPRLLGFNQGTMEEARYKLIFSGSTDNVKIKSRYIGDSTKKIFSREKLDELNIIYTKDQKGIYLDNTQPGIIFPAYTAQFTIQQKNSSKTGIHFSLLLPDRVPPKINKTDISFRYNETYQRYEVFWKPILAYTDGNTTEDIQEYRIHCSSNEFNKQTNPPSKDNLVMTINRTDGFLPSTYQAIPFMGVALHECAQGETLDLTSIASRYHIVILPVDKRLQYNMSFEDIEINALGSLNTNRALIPKEFSHQEQQNEQYTPPIQCEFGNVPTNPDDETTCQNRKALYEGVETFTEVVLGG